MATFMAGVAGSGDDAQESGGAMDLTGTNLNANATSHLSGMRFTGVTIPAGSTVTAATLELYLPSGSYDDPDVTISGEAAGNAAAFSTSSDDLTDRAKTTATVTWAANNLGTGAQTTPDLSAIVGEIVGGAGWASGNALVLFVAGNSGDSALRWAAADGSNPAAVLNVTYTPPASGPAVAVLAAHYRRLATGGAA